MIHYLKGDATNPQTKGPKIIAHVCNDAGKWGAGFVLAVSDHYPIVRDLYLRWYAGKLKSIDYHDGVYCSQGRFMLGEVQIILQLGAGKTMYVANMIAQHGIKTGSHGSPIRYDALEACLKKVALEVKQLEVPLRVPVSVHMPRIGCGLAGGRWEEVEPLITNALQGVEVYVYDYEGKS